MTHMSSNRFFSIRFGSMVAMLLGCVSTSIAHADGVCFPNNPLQKTELTSNFGMRANPDHNYALILHHGVDFRAQSPTKVYAVHSGVVTELNTPTMNVIAIKGDDGITVRYVHMSTNYPKKSGERVNAGELIGLSGTRGTGAFHLHFEARPSGGSFPVDPKQYFCPSPAISEPRSKISQTYYPNTGKPGTPVPLTLSTSGGVTSAPAGGPGPGMTGGSPAVAESKPLPSGLPKGGGIPPSAPFPDYLGKSKNEFFSEEVDRRFYSSEWITMLINPEFRNMDPDYVARNPAQALLTVAVPELMLVREIAIMSALGNAIETETFASRESTQAMQATAMQIRSQAYTRKLAEIIKTQAK